MRRRVVDDGVRVVAGRLDRSQTTASVAVSKVVTVEDRPLLVKPR